MKIQMQEESGQPKKSDYCAPTLVEVGELAQLTLSGNNVTSTDATFSV